MAGYIGSKANVSQIDGYVKSEVDTLLGQELNLSGGSMTGHLNFGDNIKIQSGAGTDLQIYHDASNSYIKDAGTGSLRLSATAIELMKVDTSELMASFAQDGAVTLYYDNAAKLATTTGGLSITGNIVVSGTVDGIDIATRDAVLTSTTTTAGAALPKAGGAMTGNITGLTALDVTGTVTADGLTMDTSANSAYTIELGANRTSASQALGIIKGSWDDNVVAQINLAAGDDTTNKDNGRIFLRTASAGSTANRLQVAENGDISFYEDTGTTAKFFWDASAESLGIGDSSPSRALSTKSASVTVGSFESTSASGGLIGFVDPNTTNDVTVRIGSLGNNLVLQAGGSTAATIDSSGNVGIGTTDPRHILDIEASTTGAIPTNADMGASNENDNYFSFHNSSNSATFSGLALETRTSGASKWLIANEWTGTYLGDLVFRVRDGGSSSSEAMRIDSSGNVGIGTASPSSFYSNANNLVVGSGSGGEGITIYSGSSDSGYIGFNDTASNGMQAFIQYNHNGDYMAFAPNGSEKMRIDSSGNVGIGTSSPTSVLHIKSDTANDVNNGILFEAAGSTNKLFRMYENSTGECYSRWYQNDAAKVLIRTNGSSYFNGGNVGIGVADPVTKLEVQDDSTWNVATISSNYTVGAGLTFDAQNGGSDWSIIAQGGGGGAGAGNLGFHLSTALAGNTAGYKMTLTDDGNVGIGDTAPSQKLNVAGNIMLEGSDNYVYLTNTGTGNSGIYVRGITASSTLRSHSTGIFTWEVSGNEKMRIDSSGNLLVGKSAISFATAGIEIKATNVISITRSANPCLNVNRIGSSAGPAIIMHYNSSDVGSIDVAASSTSYNTSSDYRLKENVDYTWDATTRLKQLKPARFNFIVDDTNTLVDGFLAHEVSSIVPEAITGTKDAVDDNGDAVMQGIDQSKIVPLLVKTIQELEARITALEA